MKAAQKAAELKATSLQDFRALRTLVGSEGSRTIRLGIPGRAWITSMRGQEGEVVCGGLSREKLQAQGKIIFYSLQNSHCLYYFIAGLKFHSHVMHSKYVCLKLP